MAGCGATVVSSIQPPQLVRNNNNGSDEYKLVVIGASPNQAIQIGVEQAQKFCKSLERKTEILVRTYAKESSTRASEISFHCWDLELAAKIQGQKQQSGSPGN